MGVPLYGMYEPDGGRADVKEDPGQRSVSVTAVVGSPSWPTLWLVLPGRPRWGLVAEQVVCTPLVHSQSNNHRPGIPWSTPLATGGLCWVPQFLGARVCAVLHLWGHIHTCQYTEW